MPLTSISGDKKYEYDLQPTNKGIDLTFKTWFGDELITNTTINLPAKDVVDWFKNTLSKININHLKDSDDSHRQEFYWAREQGYNSIAELRLVTLLKQSSYLYLDGADLDMLLDSMASHMKIVINHNNGASNDVDCCPECALHTYNEWVSHLLSELLPIGSVIGKHTSHSRFRGMAATRENIYESQQIILKAIRHSDIIKENIIRAALIEHYLLIHNYLEQDLSDSIELIRPPIEGIKY